jgi:hypothetical protein
MEVERTFRGISVRLALHYMESIGGEVTGERSAAGEGWTAELSTNEVSIGPSIEVTEVIVAFEGEEAVLDEIVPKFAQKAFRAGG